MPLYGPLPFTTIFVDFFRVPPHLRRLIPDGRRRPGDSLPSTTAGERPCGSPNPAQSQSSVSVQNSRPPPSPPQASLSPPAAAPPSLPPARPTGPPGASSAPSRPPARSPLPAACAPAAQPSERGAAEEETLLLPKGAPSGEARQGQHSEGNAARRERQLDARGESSERGDFHFYAENPWVFLLSHLHQDHISGLHGLWREGRIFCSAATRRLLLLRFPLLAPCVAALDLHRVYRLCFHAKNSAPREGKELRGGRRSEETQKKGDTGDDSEAQEGAQSAHFDRERKLTIRRRRNAEEAAAASRAETPARLDAAAAGKDWGNLIIPDGDSRRLHDPDLPPSAGQKESRETDGLGARTPANSPTAKLSGDAHEDDAADSKEIAHAEETLSLRGSGSRPRGRNEKEQKDALIVRLMLVDAHHCPGSVVFVLQSPAFGVYVHTGDFNCNPDTVNGLIENVKDAISCLKRDAEAYLWPLPAALPCATQAEQSLFFVHDGNGHDAEVVAEEALYRRQQQSRIGRTSIGRQASSSSLLSASAVAVSPCACDSSGFAASSCPAACAASPTSSSESACDSSADACALFSSSLLSSSSLRSSQLVCASPPSASEGGDCWSCAGIGFREGQRDAIDHLFLDNTYLHPVFDFSSSPASFSRLLSRIRSISFLLSTRAIAKQTRERLRTATSCDASPPCGPSHDVPSFSSSSASPIPSEASQFSSPPAAASLWILVGVDSLGKEALLQALSEKLRVPVRVSAVRFDALKQLVADSSSLARHFRRGLPEDLERALACRRHQEPSCASPKKKKCREKQAARAQAPPFHGLQTDVRQTDRQRHASWSVHTADQGTAPHACCPCSPCLQCEFCTASSREEGQTRKRRKGACNVEACEEAKANGDRNESCRRLHDGEARGRQVDIPSEREEGELSEEEMDEILVDEERDEWGQRGGKKEMCRVQLFAVSRRLLRRCLMCLHRQWESAVYMHRTSTQRGARGLCEPRTTEKRILSRTVVGVVCSEAGPWPGVCLGVSGSGPARDDPLFASSLRSLFPLSSSLTGEAAADESENNVPPLLSLLHSSHSDFFHLCRFTLALKPQAVSLLSPVPCPYARRQTAVAEERDSAAASAAVDANPSLLPSSCSASVASASAAFFSSSSDLPSNQRTPHFVSASATACCFPSSVHSSLDTPFGQPPLPLSSSPPPLLYSSPAFPKAGPSTPNISRAGLSACVEDLEGESGELSFFSVGDMLMQEHFLQDFTEEAQQSHSLGGRLAPLSSSASAATQGAIGAACASTVSPVPAFSQFKESVSASPSSPPGCPSPPPVSSHCAAPDASWSSSASSSPSSTFSSTCSPLPPGAVYTGPGAYDGDEGLALFMEACGVPSVFLAAGRSCFSALRSTKRSRLGPRPSGLPRERRSTRGYPFKNDEIFVCPRHGYLIEKQRELSQREKSGGAPPGQAPLASAHCVDTETYVPLQARTHASEAEKNARKEHHTDSPPLQAAQKEDPTQAEADVGSTEGTSFAEFEHKVQSDAPGPRAKRTYTRGARSGDEARAVPLLSGSHLEGNRSGPPGQNSIRTADTRRSSVDSAPLSILSQSRANAAHGSLPAASSARVYSIDDSDDDARVEEAEKISPREARIENEEDSRAPSEDESDDRAAGRRRGFTPRWIHAPRRCLLGRKQGKGLFRKI
ncbi:hypothetical protein BESB_073040 [Besnoitia besnoiti]|uniref:Metallo-beta-lactamase domain-containing protein n=1 Tax=Besnoitia besnoiti TaxID=94643 RepID=A0A2A9MFI2_BESBE|nr:uncharacterized protein BESB_073040 [Besnoitia besnoiti]PFH34152.1 hypothetical protein BESB_073040 [Besnoitia besnoiti]